MNKVSKNKKKGLGRIFDNMNMKLRPKLILIFLVSKVIPIILLTLIALTQISSIGSQLRDIAVADSTKALNDGARESIERLTTDTAAAVADFLRQRDQDILKLANLTPSDTAYKGFSDASKSLITKPGEWVISEDGMSWVEKDPPKTAEFDNKHPNEENNDELYGSSFNYRPPEYVEKYHEYVPLYDEITFVGLDGRELIKYIAEDSHKKHYPMNPNLSDISDNKNTYIRAENYFDELKKLKPGEIYVSDVIGAYVGTNYVGMYTPGVLKALPENPATGAAHPNREELVRIANLSEEEFIEEAKKQAYSGKENPVGQRFEAIVRFATPVMDDSGNIIGYVTMALNHDHIMEFVDYITPMIERYVSLPSAYEGDYAFIWDYKCRSIAHPRHHSIVGYNPITGEPQTPWLEGTIALERDYEKGGFIKEEYGKDDAGDPLLRTIPILGADGKTQPAKDTPYYFWIADGGAEWMSANPSWQDSNLSRLMTGKNWWEWVDTREPAGKSWGTFLAENVEKRDILPQFGERPLIKPDGSVALDADGNEIKDYQSRDKTPAAALTKAGFVGLDGRYLNNAPQCTGWMNLTENGGSGSFYILWSGLYKPTTAGAIPYYTGQYSPEVQNNQRGFAIVTIGSGIENFIAPAVETEMIITGAINTNMAQSILKLSITALVLFAVVIMIAIVLSSYLTNNIRVIIDGISRFRSGQRQFRIRSSAKDEFGTLSDSFDEMADSIVGSVNEPLSIIDLDHNIIYMNDQALAAVGKTLDEVVGSSYNDISLYPFDSRFDPINALHQDREADVLHLESSKRYYKGVAHYLLDQNSKKIGYIIMTNDVTEIENARQRAEQATHAKSNFLANMSHEIRTPMNAIIGMASIGANAADIVKKDYAIEKIQDASTHLLGVINDVLDMSKIEANKFSLSVQEFVFEKMFQRIVDVINFRVDEKKQKLTVHIDPDIPGSLVGDDQRLAQVITNLLTNAVKFTEDEGSINLEAKLEAEINGICTLRISIKDTGIGISPEQQERLFGAFEQAEASTTRKYGGTGLGLVISKNIVEMMDGTISVESELGKGSTFSFTVNLARGKDAQKKLLSDDMNLDNTRMMAVDDDTDVLKFFEEAASQIGIVCDTASGGLDALSKIAKQGSYNIYFVDWDMPEMNGIELARIINEKNEKNTVVIMISAHDWNDIREEATNVGVNKFLSKPLFVAAIADCVNECIGLKKDGADKQAEKTVDFKGHSILLAEDVDINREIVLAMLEDTNIEIDCAENGRVAVDMFLANPAKYEMIFMDLQMPEMDGYTATKAIRTSETEWGRKIPIIAMTANVFKEDIARCEKAGMNGHIGKPIDFDEVIKTLAKYLTN